MTGFDDEARDYKALDAHGVQQALRQDLGEQDMDSDPNDGTDVLNGEGASIEAVQAHEDNQTDIEEGAATLEDTSECDDTEPEVKAVWTASQMAEHARMAEALLFAAVEPLDENSISERLPAGADVPALMEAVQAQYENRGVILSKISKKWRFVTAPDVAHILERERIEQRKLSRAALETLAIIAYHQPCTRADIEDVRGVQVSRGSLDQLLEIGWVRLRGRRKSAPGRPVLYGTSQAFLEHFNLESLSDLPGMADLKAAGLLDARLPPEFSVPSPTDIADGEAEDEENAEEFATDFLENDDTETAENHDECQR